MGCEQQSRIRLFVEKVNRNQLIGTAVFVVWTLDLVKSSVFVVQIGGSSSVLIV